MKWGTLWWSVAGLAVHIAGRACHPAGGMAVQAGHGVPPDAGIARCSAVHRLLHPQLPRHGATRAVVSAGGGMRSGGSLPCCSPCCGFMICSPVAGP